MITSALKRIRDKMLCPHHICILLMLLLTLTFTINLNAQQTVNIGSGSTNSFYIPVSTHFDYNYSQQIILADEFNNAGGVAGQITMIRYYVSVARPMINTWNNWTIYIGNTTKSSFESDTDWVSVSGMTQVFSGTITPANNSWMDIVFTTPFIYDGSSNIVIAVDENTPGISGNGNPNGSDESFFGSYEAGLNTSISRAEYNININPVSPGVGYRASTVARVQLGQFDITCVPPDNVNVTPTTPGLATATWDISDSTNSMAYVYVYSTSDTPPTDDDLYYSKPPNVTSAQITGLSDGTTYYFWIRTVCTATTTSEWSNVASFTTLPAVACSPPGNVSVTPNSPGYATATWDIPDNSISTAYYYLYTTSSTPPVDDEIYYNSVSPDVTSVEISGLSGGTTYYFWIKTVCTATKSSEWSTLASFTTPLCINTTIPYYEDFESVVTPEIPECTSVQNFSRADTWHTTSDAGSGFNDKTLMIEFNGFIYPADTWFYTEGLHLEAGTSYRLSYRYGNNSTFTFYERMKVAYGTDNDVSAMAIQLADHPNINQAAPQFNTVDFVPPATGVYYIGFHAYSEEDQDRLMLDNISVTLSPPCTLPTPSPSTDNNNATFCEGATVADLQAIGTGILWYADEQGGTALNGDIQLMNGVYYASQTVNECESTDRAMLTVHITDVGQPVAVTAQIISEEQTGTATIANIEAEGENLVWYATEEDAFAGVNPLPTNTLLISGSTYYVTQTIDGCTGSPLGILITVHLGMETFNGIVFKYHPNPVKNLLDIS